MSKQAFLAFSDGADYTDLSDIGKDLTAAYVDGHTIPVPRGAEMMEIFVAVTDTLSDAIISSKVETSPDATLWAPMGMLGNTVAGVSEVTSDVLDSVFADPNPVLNESYSFQVSVLTSYYVRVKIKGDVGGTKVKAYAIFYGTELSPR